MVLCAIMKNNNTTSNIVTVLCAIMKNYNTTSNIVMVLSAIMKTTTQLVTL